uniref:Uncharacterized protein n=1 Tax=Rhizophora mucronata TaxID=61149 RepID=A0A2P2P0C6_RHIMU
MVATFPKLRKRKNIERLKRNKEINSEKLNYKINPPVVFTWLDSRAKLL